MAADPVMLFKRYDYLYGRMGNYRNTWQDLAEFFTPYKANINVKREPGTRKTQRLFDSEGVAAAKQLASQIHGWLSSEAQKWYSLRMRQQALNDVKPIRDWLEEVADATYAALNNSNFHSEIAAVYLDLPVFGTGGVYVEEAPAPHPNVFGGLQFTALTIGEYVIAENALRRVDTVFRRFELPAREVQRLWGKTIDTMTGADLKEQVEARPDEPRLILHVVYPRPEIGQGRLNLVGRKPWASCYLDFRTHTLLAEGGYDEFPYAVARWDRDDPADVWGNSPGMIAYPDVRTLNRAVELKLAAWAKAIDPPLLELDDAVIGSLSLEPAARNIATSKDAVWPLESKARFDVNAIEEARLERKISDCFFGPQIRDITKNMTATEALMVKEELLRLMGPAAGRLQAELLGPIIERAIAIQYRARVLAPPPAELLQAGFNVDIDIVYEGPLARAQRGNDLIAIQRKNEWVAAQQALGNASAGDLFDTDEEGRHVAEITGYPSNLVRGADQVAATRDARAQAQKKAAQMQVAAGAAQAAGKAAPFVKAINDVQQSQQPEVGPGRAA